MIRAEHEKLRAERRAHLDRLFSTEGCAGPVCQKTFDLGTTKEQISLTPNQIL
jgi:hypothetical protein